MKKIFILFTLLSMLSLQTQANTYDDFGQKKGLVKLVDDLMLELLADKRTKSFFINSDQEHIKEKLVEQFCFVLEGPCKYTGQNMRRAHKGHSINEAHFYALVEALQKAMETHKISQQAQNKLLAKLAPMYKDIVNE